MSNPSHRQKASKEDAPDWYIEAHLDEQANGIGVIVIQQGVPKRIPPHRYREIADVLLVQSKRHTSNLK